MQKTTLCVLSLVFVGSLAGCSSGSDSATDTSDVTTEVTDDQATDTTDITTEDAATATLEDDGSVATTGITLPGEEVSVPSDCQRESTQTATVVCAADLFLATLSDDQVSEVVLAATVANATAWSNLPCGSSCRNGIQLSTLDEEQLDAAYALLKAALGTGSDNGYNSVMRTLMADDILNASGGMQGSNATGANATTGDRTPPDGGMGTPPDGGNGGPGGGMGGGGGGYSSGTYFLAFLGEPSAEGTWMLQFGGHHLAINITYQDGEVVSATPQFMGIEPKIWTANGETYMPMAKKHDAMVAMLADLSTSELASAKLSTSFSDILLGPDADGEFPATKSGVRVGDLTDDQQQLVLDAISAWVMDADDMTSEELLALYEADLDDTYISYSGSATLKNHADYVRIDGPEVWIEMVCQSGVVYSSEIHYHTVWRDHERDYGAEYSF